MSRIVQLNVSSLKFPAKCCNCLSHEYSIKNYKDSNFISPIGIIYWKTFSLQIPLCKKCAKKPVILLVALIVISILFLLLEAFTTIVGETLFFFWFFITIVFIVVAMAQRPLKVLNIGPEKSLFRIQFRNNNYAQEFFEINGRNGKIIKPWQIGIKNQRKNLDDILAAVCIIGFIAAWTLWATLYVLYIRPYVLYFFFDVLGIPIFPVIFHVFLMFAIPIIAVAVVYFLYKFRIKIG